MYTGCCIHAIHPEALFSIFLGDLNYLFSLIAVSTKPFSSFFRSSQWNCKIEFVGGWSVQMHQWSAACVNALVVYACSGIFFSFTVCSHSNEVLFGFQMKLQKVISFFFLIGEKWSVTACLEWINSRILHVVRKMSTKIVKRKSQPAKRNQ